MKIVATLLSVITISVLGAVGVAYSGIYSVSALDSHNGLIHWLLSTTSHASVKRRAKDIQVPDLDRDSLVDAGVNDFDKMCVDCHGAPGKTPTAVGQGLNPSAPDLAESAEYMTPAELFWVTKNGIKMTGMPAWGATHDDDALWPVVAFMTVLPTLDAQAYEALLVDAEGMGHHDSSEVSHDETSANDHQENIEVDQAEVAEHDHSTHSHNENPSLAEPNDEEEEHGNDDHEH